LLHFSAPTSKSIFIFGGFDGKEDLKTCERYRVDTNSWQKLPELPQARNGSCAIQFEEEKVLYLWRKKPSARFNEFHLEIQHP